MGRGLPSGCLGSAAAVLPGNGFPRLAADDALQPLDGRAQCVDLGVQGRKLRVRLGVARFTLELLITRSQQSSAVVFLCDIAAEQFARANVDRMILEDVVEE